MFGLYYNDKNKVLISIANDSQVINDSTFNMDFAS